MSSLTYKVPSWRTGCLTTKLGWPFTLVCTSTPVSHIVCSVVHFVAIIPSFLILLAQVWTLWRLFLHYSTCLLRCSLLLCFSYCHDFSWLDMNWHDMSCLDMACHDFSWPDMTWHGLSRLVMAFNTSSWLEMTWHGLSWLVMTCHGLTWLDMACHDLTWLDMACHGLTCFIMVFLGLSWLDMACHGLTWLVMVCHGFSWLVMAWHELSDFKLSVTYVCHSNRTNTNYKACSNDLT